MRSLASRITVKSLRFAYPSGYPGALTGRRLPGALPCWNVLIPHYLDHPVGSPWKT